MRAAARIVEAILDELNDRKGFDQWWEGIEPEDRNEIRDILIDIAEANIDG